MLQFYHGANVHGPRSVACCPIRLEETKTWLEGDGLTQLAAFLQRKTDLRLEPPSDSATNTESFAAIFAKLLMALQREAQSEAEIAPWFVVSSEQQADVYFEFEREDIARGAIRYALALIHHAYWLSRGEPERAESETAKVAAGFNRLAQHYTAGWGMKLLCDRARQRGIAVDRVAAGFHILGEGRFQRRRYWGFTDRTSHLGVELTTNKNAALQLLGSRGLPVPRHIQARTVEQAITAANAIGYPVVMKPLAADFGRGVRLNVNSDAAIRDGWSYTAEYGPVVLIERYITGRDYRVFVADGRMLCAAERCAPTVTGDGVRGISELVAELNNDPRRGLKSDSWLVALVHDDDMDSLLAERGYDFSSIPASGEVVPLRRVPTMSSGGHSRNVTNDVHPDNRLIAEWAAALFAIDLCGVDFICPDISRSYREVGGAICEVNASPGLQPHGAAEGQQIDIVDTMLGALYPPGAESRIHKTLVVGAAENERALSVAKSIAEQLVRKGHCVGTALFGHVVVEDLELTTDALAGPAAAVMLTGHPAIDAIVLLVAPEDIAAHGLGITECDITVIVDPDGLGATEPEQATVAVATSLAHNRPAIAGEDPATIVAEFVTRIA